MKRGSRMSTVKYSSVASDVYKRKDYYTLMSLIFSTYFIASIVPGLSIFDWVIKGSVAVFIFNFIHVNPLTIVSVTTFMWLLNFAVPALIGSLFVLNFKMVTAK